MGDNQNNLLIAGSIVAAGALIAVGIYLAPTNGNTGTTADNQQNANAATRQITLEEVTESDHIRGDVDAAVKIVEYSDLECPFCKEFHGVMKQVVDQYDEDQVAWVYRHFPLEQLHSKAPAEAHASECAAELGGNEGFWAYVDRLYEVTPSNDGLDLDRLPEIASDVGLDAQAFTECQQSDRHADTVDAQYQDARNAGGTGTPYNVFVLEEELSDEREAQLQQMFRGAREGQFVISEDKRKIAISGGLPVQGITQVLDVILGTTGSATTTSQ